jgi:hypothetical protein
MKRERDIKKQKGDARYARAERARVEEKRRISGIAKTFRFLPKEIYIYIILEEVAQN